MTPASGPSELALIFLAAVEQQFELQDASVSVTESDAVKRTKQRLQVTNPKCH